ncbi:MAG TPA: hypothetical protein VE244_07405 [Nitrososphaeraceae archaeon]|nr:hypothetical protein [Nitrososphaeraceae archaeon]
MSKDKELSSAQKDSHICDNCGKSFSTIEEFPTHYKMIILDHSITLVHILTHHTNPIEGASFAA